MSNPFLVLVWLLCIPVAVIAGYFLATPTDLRTPTEVQFIGKDPEFYAKSRKATHDQGPQVLLEMSGSARAIRQGFKSVRNGGTVALLGLPSKPVEIDLPNDIIFKGIKVLGINGRLMYETWFQVESFLLSRSINIDPIVTHQLPMEEFDEGVKLMQSGEAIKVVLQIPQA